MLACGKFKFYLSELSGIFSKCLWFMVGWIHGWDPQIERTDYIDDMLHDLEEVLWNKLKDYIASLSRLSQQISTTKVMLQYW